MLVIENAKDNIMITKCCFSKDKNGNSSWRRIW